MFQSKKKKSSRDVLHADKLRLRTDASRDKLCSRALNTQLPRVTAERAIHLSPSNEKTGFWSEPMKFLVDMPNQAH